jgi:hypothetical protein
VSQGYVEYNSNNSGGRWWLSDQNWLDLEKAGWRVEWLRLANLFNEEGNYVLDEEGLPLLVERTDPRIRKGDYVPRLDKDGRHLGALARQAYRVGLSLRDAASEWEKVTGLDSTAAGCSCCGQPHRFTEYDGEGKHVASGPNREETCRW